jgi:hypothetical protein
VVARALGLPDDTPDPPSDGVYLTFPLIDVDEPQIAQVACWHPVRDVTGLVLAEPPSEAAPVQLVEADALWGHCFGACGFPAGYADGVWTSGVLRGRTGAGWVQIDGTKNPSYWVEPGFSGAPIWGEDLNGVVGMAVAAEEDRAIKAAYMIPTKTLLAAWPKLMEDAACSADPVLNPFYDRGRINDPARLFDRHRILRELRQALAVGNHVSLVGEREIGKSSVLYALYKTADEWLPEKRVHYLDLQAVIDEDDFCAEVLEGMGRESGGLRALKRVLRREPLVLLLDEVEKLNRPAFTQNLHDLLRALAQRLTLTLAVASYSPLNEVFPPENPTSPLHNIFTQKQLGPFAARDARQFLRQRLQRTGVVFDSSEIERLVVKSGCHPAQLQRMAYRLFDQKRGG